MNQALKILPVVLFAIVGLISAAMAFKNLSAKRILPFNEKASGKLWNDLENPFKLVILSLMKLVGLGFLIMSFLTIIFPFINYFEPNPVYEYLVPAIALAYCAGLFAVNFSVYKKTKAETPWKGSLYAAVIILIGIVISVLS